MAETLNWIHDKLNFVKSHTRKKGLSKSYAFKSAQRAASASAVSAHNISQGSIDTVKTSIL